MSDAFREQTPAIDSASLSETQGRGESAAGRDSRSEHFPFPQPSDGDPLRGGISMSNSPLGYQLRSPMSRTFSRSSSGYFSVDSDSVPSSPLMPNISEAQGSQNDEVWFADISHQHGQMAAPVAMRHEEILVARELRRIGDDFNRLYFHEAGAGNNNAARNEHVIIVWMNDFIGQLMQIFLRRR
ncbi:bcl-2-like protein 11 [Triplophysa rosa]|uniref:Bcl-2-like protein 11 n=1 Tax=Triplophysa rosa TaxID=992332 RepID=A0A9W7WNU2_TRIRA|nr:bcl-2-like protein 11 [Triplophysa rosa]KAI7805593.1 putative bcl-2-like protein 11 [Triplophysa rosa]